MKSESSMSSSVPNSAIFASKWQHPLFDVLKHAEVGKVDIRKLEGDIKSNIDRTIGKTVLQIKGVVPAANFVQLPCNNDQSLGLTGSYVYVQLKTHPPQNFVLHIDVHTSTPNLVLRISFSNLFKDKKCLGRALQVPVLIFQQRWTVFCIDLVELLASNTSYEYTGIKSMQLCASMTVRSVFTSSILYAPDNIPREMALPLNGKPWMQLYDWVWCPKAPNKKEKSPVNEKNSKTKSQSRIRNAMNSNSRSQSIVSSNQSCLHQSNSNDVHVEKGNTMDIAATRIDSESVPKRLAPVPSRHPSTHGVVPLLVVGKDERTNGHCHKALNEALIEQDCLRPDPIMRLTRVIGFSGDIAGGVVWASTSGNVVAYPCNNIVVIEDLKSKKQSTLLGHTSNLTALTISADKQILVTGESGLSSNLCVWSLSSGDKLGTINAVTSALKDVCISADSSLLAATGIDAQKKEQIFVWDISAMSSKEQAKLIARQTSEFDIVKMVFMPHVGHLRELATCGNENIRFWRIKNQHLPSCSLVLNEHCRNKFCSLAFESVFNAQNDTTLSEQSPRILFVGSGAGAIFKVDVAVQSLLQVYKLHTAPIRSLFVSESFCVTGSDDEFVRVWPLDFSEFLMEAKHESGVTSVSLADDGLKAVVGTAGGTLGLLDLAEYTYTTYVRGHVDVIQTIALSPLGDEFASASIDATIRIWDIKTFDQVYEFNTEGERAMCLAYHPSQNELACGFESGLVRVYDIPNMMMKYEFHEHTGTTFAIVITSHGRRMFSASSDRHIGVHDVMNQYQPVRMMSAAFAALNDDDDAVVSMSVNNDGSLLAAPSSLTAGEVVLYDVDNLIVRSRLHLQGGSALLIKFSRNQRELLVITVERYFLRFDVSTSQLRSSVCAKMNAQISFICMELSCEGQFILTGDSERRLRVWNYSSSHQLALSQGFSAHCAPVMSIVFASNDRVLSVGGNAIFCWRFLGDDSPKIAQTAQVDECNTSATISLEGEGRSRTSLEENHEELNENSQMKADIASLAASMVPIVSSIAEKHSEESIPTNEVVHCRYTSRYSHDPSSMLYTPPNNEQTLQIEHICGFSSNARNGLIWHPPTGFFAYCSGHIVVIENLSTRVQRLLNDVTGEISCMCVSPNGLILAVGEGLSVNTCTAIALFDVGDLTLRAKLSFHTSGVQRMAFNVSSRYLASVGVGSDDSSAVVVWDTRDGSMIANEKSILPNSTVDSYKSLGWIHDLMWVPRSHYMFVTASQYCVVMWSIGNVDAHSNNLQRSLTCTLIVDSTSSTSWQFTSVAFLNDHIVLCGTTSGEVSAWNIERHSAPIRSWKAHNGEITSIRTGEGVCQSDTLHAVVVGVGSSLTRWKLTLNSECSELEAILDKRCDIKGANLISAAVFEPSLNVGIVGTTNGTIVYCTIDDGTTTRLITTHASDVCALIFSPIDDRFLASCGADGSVRLWCMNGQQIFHFEVADQACRCVVFHPSGKQLAAGYTDGNLRIIDIHSMSLQDVYTPPQDTSPISAICYLPDGSIIIVGSANGAVHFVDTASCETVFNIREHIGARIDCIEMSRLDSSICVISDSSCVVSVWRIEDEERSVVDASLITIMSMRAAEAHTFEPPASHPSFVAPTLVLLSPCEYDVLMCSSPSCHPEIQFFNFIDKTVIRRILLPHLPVSLDVSPDASFIIVGTIDRLITLIDYDSGDYHDVCVHDDKVSAVAFNSSASMLASSSFGEIALFTVCEVSEMQ